MSHFRHTSTKQFGRKPSFYKVPYVDNVFVIIMKMLQNTAKFVIIMKNRRIEKWETLINILP